MLHPSLGVELAKERSARLIASSDARRRRVRRRRPLRVAVGGGLVAAGVRLIGPAAQGR